LTDEACESDSQAFLPLLYATALTRTAAQPAASPDRAIGADCEADLACQRVSGRGISPGPPGG